MVAISQRRIPKDQLCKYKGLRGKYLLQIRFNSGAPAGAEGARERSIHTYKIGKPIKPRKFGCDVMSVRTCVRTPVLGMVSSVPLSLIWSSS